MALDGRTVQAATGRGFDLARWFATPRLRGVAGVYGLGPAPRTAAEQAPGADVPAAKLLFRAALNALVAWLVFYYVGGLPVFLFRSWISGWVGHGPGLTVITVLAYLPVVWLIVRVFGRMGRWLLVWHRFLKPGLGRALAATEPKNVPIPAQGEAPVPESDPWAALRAVTPAEALALLEAETAQGRVNDVDHQRLLHALECVRHDPERLSALLTAIRDHGAAACAHPSGARELPGRGPRHDLLLRQLRLGHAESVPKNPAEYRGVDIALDPALLGTSILAVGPAGTGKTARLARPVAEGLCLQALSGTAVAVVVGAAGADLGPADWYDVVIAPGEPGSRYGLDLFGGSRNPEEAAARLADALLTDELAQRGESARLAVQQLVLPFADAHGRLPGVRELGALLRGDAEEWALLTDALGAAGQWERHRHQLAQRRRLHGQADDPGTLLADRLALLERPAFAGAFNASAGDPEPLPLFAVHALDHPLRVRVALPEQSHPEAARILARLVVGQFLHAAGTRGDRTLFAGLVVDDASAAVDAHGVRALQRLRTANAGAVLVLRSLTDLPEQLRTPLFGAVGGRMAFPGIAPWDGQLFADAWGTVWVDERDVTRTPDTSGGMLRRGLRGARAVLEGEKVTTESVTTRKVERRRWSSSDLAHTLPAGHAVLSLTAVDGTPVPPLLIDLRA